MQLMAAAIVIVGGPHSGVGKTLAAELALEELRGCSFGAIKLTVADGERDPHDHGDSALLLAHAAGICGRGDSCGVCETVSTKIPSRLITSSGAIHKHGTDTWRLANAGAVAVAWVIALRDAAPAALAGAIEHVQAAGVRGIVIEGTTALEWIRPRAAVMVATNPGKAWKRVARERIGSCQIALWNRMPRPAGEVAPPPEFFAAAPVACDLSDPAERGTVWFRQRLRELCGLTALPSSAASAR
jgi:hypothetical protein